MTDDTDDGENSPEPIVDAASLETAAFEWGTDDSAAEEPAGSDSPRQRLRRDRMQQAAATEDASEGPVGRGDGGDSGTSPPGDERGVRASVTGVVDGGLDALDSAFDDAFNGFDAAAIAGVGSRGTESTAIDPEPYLFAGEDVVARLPLQGGWLLVTSHRVLAFDPTGDGRRFHAVDRLNVVDVDATGGGDPAVLRWALRVAAYAVLFVAGGLLAQSLGLRSLFSVSASAADAPGVAGLTSMLTAAGTLVGLLVDGLLVVGLLASVAAVALGVVYLRGRYPSVVVDVAGAETLTLRLSESVNPGTATATLREALEPELDVGN